MKHCNFHRYTVRRAANLPFNELTVPEYGRSGALTRDPRPAFAQRRPPAGHCAGEPRANGRKVPRRGELRGKARRLVNGERTDPASPRVRKQVCRGKRSGLTEGWGAGLVVSGVASAGPLRREGLNKGSGVGGGGGRNAPPPRTPERAAGEEGPHGASPSRGLWWAHLRHRD